MSGTERTRTGEWAKDFSYDYYRRLLRTLRANFDLRTLSEFDESDEPRTADEPVAFVRHDVDVCLERALEMAQVEHELGVRATYMVIPDTPLYDLEEERDLLHLIHELGHEIALHCDLDAPIGTGADTDALAADGLFPAERRQVRDARRRVESVSFEPVGSLSFHQPPGRVLEGPRTIAGMVNAYGADLMSAYISDSSGRWREGEPIDWITTGPLPDRLQVLTHPVWWADRHRPPVERFVAVADKFDALDERMYDELVSICPEYGERVEPRLVRPRT